MGTRKPKKTKSFQQVKFLLGKGSPLSPEQRAKLKNELHSGEVKIKRNRKKKP